MVPIYFQIWQPRTAKYACTNQYQVTTSETILRVSSFWCAMRSVCSTLRYVPTLDINSFITFNPHLVASCFADNTIRSQRY